MASSSCGQYDPNHALWLATRAGARSGLPAVSHEQNFTDSHIINPLLTKFARPRWLDTGFVLFCEFVDRDEVEVHKHAKKELGQSPAILSSNWSITHMCSTWLYAWLESFKPSSNNLADTFSKLNYQVHLLSHFLIMFVHSIISGAYSRPKEWRQYLATSRTTKVPGPNQNWKLVYSAIHHFRYIKIQLGSEA